MDLEPRLIALGGPENGRIYPLDGDEITLGRAGLNNIQVAWDISISRIHARLRRQHSLYWLEDLGSANGTYLAMAGGAERSLVPGEPALLLEGAQLRLGRLACFQAFGLAGGQDEARQALQERLQQVIGQVYAGLSYLSPAEQQAQWAWLRAFEEQVGAASSEAALQQVIGDGAQTLFATLQSLTPQQPAELPPLPEDLPRPDSDALPESILNFFISDIKRCLPDEEDEEGGQGGKSHG